MNRGPDRTRSGSKSSPAASSTRSTRGSKLELGTLAQNGSLRVIGFRIGTDEFAVISHPAGVPVDPSKVHRRVAGPRDLPLTPAEWATALLAVSGMSNREIAKKRLTSISTIANQLAAVYKKLGISSRTELALCFENTLSIPCRPA
jgi:DNA-binding CsgD family transcriptional regulator